MPSSRRALRRRGGAGDRRPQRVAAALRAGALRAGAFLATAFAAGALAAVVRAALALAGAFLAVAAGAAAFLAGAGPRPLPTWVSSPRASLGACDGVMTESLKPLSGVMRAFLE